MRESADHMAGERKLHAIRDEKWKVIPGTEEKYMVSNYGRVKSYSANPEGKILKLSVTKGFKSVCIRLHGKRKTVLVHKLTANAFVPKKDGDDMILHLDWNKGNNYYKNLQWINRESGYKRILDRLHEQNRRNPRKRKITNSKLEQADIEVLKAMLKKGIKQKVIAQLFCISEMQVSRIKKGENWGSIKAKSLNN